MTSSRTGFFWGLIKDHYQRQHATEQQPLKVKDKQTSDLHSNIYFILQINPADDFKEAKWALRHALCWKYSKCFKHDGKKEWNIDLLLCDSSLEANPAGI